MIVSALKQLLDKYPDSMEVVVEKYSDYALIDRNECQLMTAVPTDWGVMRHHPSMSEDNLSKAKTYLRLSC